MNVLVTGGAGFIGSAVCLGLIAGGDHRVINLDKLTYAANRRSLAHLEGHPRYRFVEGDIADEDAVAALLEAEAVDVVLHLAAESHTDRSIDAPAAFVETNVVGTFRLLEAARRHWSRLSGRRRDRFRFLHASTDEVYGALAPDEGDVTERTAYAPSSPYSASKAASNHLALAWWRTYGLPVVVSNGSNTFGPRQFPEKLVPLVILKALEGRPIPVYGTGENVRDWLFVEDHARALERVATMGRPGQTYNIGGGSPRTNLSVVEAICDRIDALRPSGDGHRRRDLIGFVADRPGHDLRYAMDATRIAAETGWLPRESFESGLDKTVRWYLDPPDTWRPLVAGGYAGERLGTLDGAGAL